MVRRVSAVANVASARFRVALGSMVIRRIVVAVAISALAGCGAHLADRGDPGPRETKIGCEGVLGKARPPESVNDGWLPVTEFRNTTPSAIVANVVLTAGPSTGSSADRSSFELKVANVSIPAGLFRWVPAMGNWMEYLQGPLESWAWSVKVDSCRRVKISNDSSAEFDSTETGVAQAHDWLLAHCSSKSIAVADFVDSGSGHVGAPVFFGRGSAEAGFEVPVCDAVTSAEGDWTADQAQGFNQDRWPNLDVGGSINVRSFETSAVDRGSVTDPLNEARHCARDLEMSEPHVAVGASLRTDVTPVVAVRSRTATDYWADVEMRWTLDPESVPRPRPGVIVRSTVYGQGNGWAAPWPWVSVQIGDLPLSGLDRLRELAPGSSIEAALADCGPTNADIQVRKFIAEATGPCLTLQQRQQLEGLNIIGGYLLVERDGVPVGFQQEGVAGAELLRFLGSVSCSDLLLDWLDGDSLGDESLSISVALFGETL